METMNAKAPELYTTQKIRDSIQRGTFFRKGNTLEESIALHLQAALEKGFDMGRRSDPTSENVRLREALKARVMVWEDPATRDYKVCDICGNAAIDGHKSNCVLA